MSLFGSREDDPLLQGDPFAPSSDESPDGGASDDASSKDASPNDSSPDDSSPDSSSRPESPAVPSSDTRTVVYSRDEAHRGAFSELNRALAQGWRLDAIQLQGNDSLVISLRRDTDRGGGDMGTII